MWRKILLSIWLCGVAAAQADVLNDTVNGPHPAEPMPARLVVAGITLRHYPPSGQPPTEEITVARGAQHLLWFGDQHFELNYQMDSTDPLVILTGWTGGAHCCFTLHVLSLAPGVRQQAIGVDDNDEVGFIEQKDGPPLLQFGDFNFAYWHAAFVDSPAPRVILRWDPAARRYAADFAAMRANAPKPAEPKGEIGPALWRGMLDLIYAGQAPAARQLLDHAWPQGHKGKERFLACFTKQLRSGKLWRQFGLGHGLEADAAFPPLPVSARACRADW